MTTAVGIWLRALRVTQWTKNAVVFVAWFFAVADASQASMARGVRPFLLVCLMALSFSLVASAFYLLNDVSARRSVKVIGISASRSPICHMRKFISIWKEYPKDRMSEKSPSLSSAARVKHLKPPVGSITGVPSTNRMKRPPK